MNNPSLIVNELMPFFGILRKHALFLVIGSFIHGACNLISALAVACKSALNCRFSQSQVSAQLPSPACLHTALGSSVALASPQTPSDMKIDAPAGLPQDEKQADCTFHAAIYHVAMRTPSSCAAWTTQPCPALTTPPPCATRTPPPCATRTPRCRR